MEKNKIFKTKDVIIFLLAFSIVFGSISCVLLSAIPFEKEVNREMEGVYFDKNVPLDTVENVTISISGTYTNYVIEWWNDDFYEFSFTLSNAPHIEWGGKGTLYRQDERDDFILSLNTYGSYKIEDEREYLSAEMLFDSEISKCILTADDGTGSVITYDQYYIFPVADIYEAVDLFDELTGQGYRIDIE